MSLKTMIEDICQHHGFHDSRPLLLGSIYAAIRLENLLHDAGIPWRSVCEVPEFNSEYGQHRRWIVLVPAAHLDETERIADQEGFARVNSLPTPFASDLCSAHDYETAPCSYCYTGYDWWFKSDDEAAKAIPPRHPSPI